MTTGQQHVTAPVAGVLNGAWWSVPENAENWIDQQHADDAAALHDRNDDDSESGDGGDAHHQAAADRRCLAAASRREGRRFLLPDFWRSPMVRPTLVGARLGAAAHSVRAMARVCPDGGDAADASPEATLHTQLTAGAQTATEALTRVSRFSDRVNVSWTLLRSLQEAASADLADASDAMSHFVPDPVAGTPGSHPNPRVDAIDGAAALCRLDMVASSLRNYLGTADRKRAACHLQATITADVFDTSARDVVLQEMVPALGSVVGMLTAFASLRPAAAAAAKAHADDLATAADQLSAAVTVLSTRVAGLVGLWSPSYRPSDIDTLSVLFLRWYAAFQESTIARVRTGAASTGSAAAAEKDVDTTIRGLSPDQVEALLGNGPATPVCFDDATAVTHALLMAGGDQAAHHKRIADRLGSPMSRAVVVRTLETLRSFSTTVCDGWSKDCDALSKALRRADEASTAAVAFIYETRQQLLAAPAPKSTDAEDREQSETPPAPPLVRPLSLPPMPSRKPVLMHVGVNTDVSSAAASPSPTRGGRRSAHTDNATANGSSSAATMEDDFDMFLADLKTTSHHHGSPPRNEAAPAAAVIVHSCEAAISAVVQSVDEALQTCAADGYAPLFSRGEASVQTDFDFSAAAAAEGDDASPPSCDRGAMVADDGTPERRLERALMALGKEQARRRSALREVGVQAGPPLPITRGPASGSLFPPSSMAHDIGRSPSPAAPVDHSGNVTVATPPPRGASVAASDESAANLASAAREAAQAMAVDPESRTHRIEHQRSSLAVYGDALASLKSDIEEGAARVAELEHRVHESRVREESLLEIIDGYHGRIDTAAREHGRAYEDLAHANGDLRNKCSTLAVRVEELETQNIALAHRLGGVLAEREIFSSLAQRGSSALKRDASASVDHAVVSPMDAVSRMNSVRGRSVSSSSSTTAGLPAAGLQHAATPKPAARSNSSKALLSTPPSQTADSIHAVSAAASPTPGTWKELVDPKSGRTYYYDTATKKTTWSRPADF